MNTTNTIGERIAFLIRTSGLTKSKFAESLNLSQPFVSNICNGNKIPSDRTISDICRLFNVSEAWLRDGEGEMFVSRSFNQQLALMINELLEEEDSSFRKRFLAAMLEIPPDLWPHIQRFVESLAKKKD